MSIEGRIPNLSDKELENLHSNAIRLAQSGAPLQRLQAEELLPLLAAVLKERQSLKVAAVAEKRQSNLRRAAVTRRVLKEKSG